MNAPDTTAQHYPYQRLDATDIRCAGMRELGCVQSTSGELSRLLGQPTVEGNVVLWRLVLARQTPVLIHSAPWPPAHHATAWHVCGTSDTALKCVQGMLEIQRLASTKRLAEPVHRTHLRTQANRAA